jgi:uncharacterized pyridoxamine 5'-phosphate oxidase family protein
MDNQIDIKTLIEGALQDSLFAVLTTESGGQPHASLIAVTPSDGCRRLIFATYRGTRKYRNLIDNSKIAVFIDRREAGASGAQEGFVLTALGHAEEIGSAERAAALGAHLKRHPALESFLSSEDCALFHVTVESCQIVGGIDDVRWWSVNDPAAT